MGVLGAPSRADRQELRSGGPTQASAGPEVRLKAACSPPQSPGGDTAAHPRPRRAAASRAHLHRSVLGVDSHSGIFFLSLPWLPGSSGSSQELESSDCPSPGSGVLLCPRPHCIQKEAGIFQHLRLHLDSGRAWWQLPQGVRGSVSAPRLRVGRDQTSGGPSGPWTCSPSPG